MSMKRLNEILPAACVCLAMLFASCTKAPEPVQENEPSGQENDPSGQGDGQEDVTFTPEDLQMVDLGLSVKWASKNLDAAAPADAGGRFAWGELKAKESFSWDNYAWGEDMSKYNADDGKLVLDPEDDAAQMALEGYWRMPTKQEWEELKSTSNCSWTWEKKDGISGYTVTSLRNGNSIFLPCAKAATEASYWSASLSGNAVRSAYMLTFDEGKTSVLISARKTGLFIRPVNGAEFRIVTPAATIMHNTETLDVEVVSSLEYHITSTPDWIEEASVEELGLGRKMHHFNVSVNETEESRTGVIVFCNQDNQCVPFSVTQRQNQGVNWNKEFFHRSLMMRFTATWCGWCPYMADAVKVAQSTLPGKIVPLNLHASDSDLAFSQTNTLANQYNIKGYPTGIADGRAEINNTSDSNYTASVIVAAVKETEQYYPVTAAIGLNSSISGSTLNVDVTLYLRKAEDYKFTLMVTESGIICPQADYHTNSYVNDYQHDDIARISVTAAKGDAISSPGEMSVVEKHYSTTIPSSYNKSNLKLVAYVQRAFGSQTEKSSGSYGGYYVDNAVVVPVGQEFKPDYAE